MFLVPLHSSKEPQSHRFDSHRQWRAVERPAANWFHGQVLALGLLQKMLMLVMSAFVYFYLQSHGLFVHRMIILDLKSISGGKHQ